MSLPESPAASVREVSSIGHALQSVSQLARLAQFTALRSLVLHGGPLRSLEGLAACANSLEELNLSGNELGVCAGLGALPKLKMLNLVRRKMPCWACGAIAAVPVRCARACKAVR